MGDPEAETVGLCKYAGRLEDRWQGHGGPAVRDQEPLLHQTQGPRGQRENPGPTRGTNEQGGP